MIQQFLLMSNRLRSIIARLLVLTVLFSCESEKPKTLRIAVSANAESLATALVEAFDSTGLLAPQLILGSSGKLSAQIANGAPLDIFLAADTSYPDFLYNEGYGQRPPGVYARGVLVLMSKDSIPRHEMLFSNTTKRIAIANPDLAPYGKASKEYLQSNGQWENLAGKFVYAENALQAAVFTNTKAADLGLGALSVALKLSEKENFYYTPIDPELYKPIDQAALLLKREEQLPQATAFYDFLFSSKARQIIAAYGYKLAD